VRKFWGGGASKAKGEVKWKGEGKYGHPLVAAVARFDDDDGERGEVLELFLGLEKKIPAEVYRAALERAWQLRDKDVFKQVLAAVKGIASKDGKWFPSVKGVLAQFKKMRRERSIISDVNSDFGDDVAYERQDIDSEDDDDEEEEEEQGNQEEQTQQTSSRSLGGGAERSGDAQQYQQGGGAGLPYRSAPTARGGGGEQGWQQPGQSFANTGSGSWGGNGDGGQMNSTGSRGFDAGAGKIIPSVPTMLMIANRKYR
jgi:hypothetical protein